jgi:hypothetical protein
VALDIARLIDQGMSDDNKDVLVFKGGDCLVCYAAFKTEGTVSWKHYSSLNNSSIVAKVSTPLCSFNAVIAYVVNAVKDCHKKGQERDFPIHE